MNRPSSASFKGRKQSTNTNNTIGTLLSSDSPPNSSDLAYAKSVEKSLHRVMSARQNISSNDPNSSTSTSPISFSEDTENLQDQPPTAYSTNQLGTNQLDMHFDLHTHSSKPNVMESNQNKLDSQTSLHTAAESSVLVQGNAVNDLSGSSAMQMKQPLQHISPVPQPGSLTQNSTSIRNGYISPSSQQQQQQQQHVNESLWDSDGINLTETEDGYSPVLDPPLSASDMESLYAYIGQYKVEQVELDYLLQPFLPDYIPAIGDLEAMIKIPPPGVPSAASPTSAGNDDMVTDESVLRMHQDLGITLLDEPAVKQSDMAVLHYQLKQESKIVSSQPETGNSVGSVGLVHPIQVETNIKKLNEWIESTNSVQWSSSRTPIPIRNQNHHHQKFPLVDKLMDTWDPALLANHPDFISTLTTTNDQGMGILGCLDIPLADLVKVACAITNIPVHPNPKYDVQPRSLIDSLHCLFEVYSSFAQNHHFVNNDRAGGSGSMAFASSSSSSESAFHLPEAMEFSAMMD